MKYSDICANILDVVETPTTAVEIISRLNLQAIGFAMDELRSTPVSALAGNQTKEDIRIKLNAMRFVVNGHADMDYALLDDFTFNYQAGRLSYEVSMSRRIGTNRNWVSSARFYFSLDRWEPNGPVHIDSVSHKIKTSREMLNDVLMVGADFNEKMVLVNFLNYFTHSPADMMRHGFMMMDDIDHSDFSGVQIRPVRDEVRGICMGVTLKYNHILGRHPELFLPMEHAIDEETGKDTYNMRGAVDYNP